MEALGRREQAGFVRFFMLYLTLWPGMVVGALGMLVPQRGMPAFAAAVSFAHLVIGLGYLP